MLEAKNTTVEELAIRNLVARYADAVNRRDEALWGSTWAADGEWLILGHQPRGRDDVVALWRNLMGSFSFVLQLIHSGNVDIGADHVTGRWYMSEIWKRADGSSGLTVGVYQDFYVQTEGDWRFSRRRIDLLYMGPPDLSAEPIPLPNDFESFTKGAAS